MIDMSSKAIPHEQQGEIPDVFCWTKMGTEAGQSLRDILHRKELERVAGDGNFAWGIGNSLGNSTRLAKQQAPNGEVQVLFTPMKSPPKIVDSAPSQLFLWLYYEKASGAIGTLPKHTLITSRGHDKKRSHYALLCHSSEKIAENDLGGFDASCVRNLVSMNPVGASQVTSVVRHQTLDIEEKPYRVSFRAKLYGEGFVKLIEPIIMNQTLLMMYEEACSSASPSDWYSAVLELKKYASQNFGRPLLQTEIF